MMFAGALLIVPVQNSFSQETLPSVEKIAEKRSNYLKDALALSDKQYKKVYDIILAEENACKEYVEQVRAEKAKKGENPEVPSLEKPDKPADTGAALKDEKPVPPQNGAEETAKKGKPSRQDGCPYAYGPRGCYYGDPCCMRGGESAPAPRHKKNGKGYEAKNNPQMREFRMGMDSIKSEYNAKIIGVLTAEQTEKYLLITRPGQRPLPPAECDNMPRPHHHHGYGRR